MWGDASQWLPRLPANSVDLFFTSPPYADARAYSRISPDRYVEWFVPFAEAMLNAVSETGSFVLNIKNRVAKSGPLKGQRHPYVYELVLALQNMGWRWTETYIWRKPNAIPGRFGPRTKDAFEYVYHFAKGPSLYFDLDAVRIPYKTDPGEIARRSLDTNGRRNTEAGFGRDRARTYGHEGADPGNVITVGQTYNPAQRPGRAAYRGDAGGSSRVLRQGSLPTRRCGRRPVCRFGHHRGCSSPPRPPLWRDRTARRVCSRCPRPLGQRPHPGGTGTALCRSLSQNGMSCRRREPPRVRHCVVERSRSPWRSPALRKTKLPTSSARVLSPPRNRHSITSREATRWPMNRHSMSHTRVWPNIPATLPRSRAKPDQSVGRGTEDVGTSTDDPGFHLQRAFLGNEAHPQGNDNIGDDSKELREKPGTDSGNSEEVRDDRDNCRRTGRGQVTAIPKPAD